MKRWLIGNQTLLENKLLRNYSQPFAISFGKENKEKKTKEYDMIVIGGGSGGITAASESSELGAKVVCFNGVTSTKHGNKWGIGGTCVNVGCIPKKLFHFAAEYQDVLKEGAKPYGFQYNNVNHSWEKLQSSIMEYYVRALNFNYTSKLNTKHVEFEPQFVSKINEDNSVITHTGDVFKAKHILISTGCRPVELDIEGFEHTITSDDMFFQKKHPGNTLIIGSGYIAMECAGFIASLGKESSKAEIAVRSNKILSSFDREAVDHLLEQSQAHYKNKLNIKYNCTVSKIELDGDKKRVTFNDGETAEYDTVLVAIGRKPSWKSLELPKNVVVNEKSQRIEVNDQFESNQKNVYAIGDVVHNAAELTPVAIASGKSLANNLFGKKKVLKKKNYIATTIFSSPLEYASIGVHDGEQLEQVTVYRRKFNILEHMLREKPYPGFIKLVCDKNDIVIGFHLVSPNAGEIAQAVAVAMNLGVTKENLDDLIGIHPTIAEVMTHLRLGEEEDDGC
mmetsp:Transcript_831/g.1298  ORF Transcript_831/g.1298 Transcript_831/m.1298 type:complete len:507 (+) Transcript_831:31-1551(+)